MTLALVCSSNNSSIGIHWYTFGIHAHKSQIFSFDCVMLSVYIFYYYLPFLNTFVRWIVDSILFVIHDKTIVDLHMPCIPAHMMLSIREMGLKGIRHHAHLNNLSPYISLARRMTIFAVVNFSLFSISGHICNCEPIISLI